MAVQILSSPGICHFLKLHPNLKMHRAWHISRSNPLLKEQAHHVISRYASWRPMSCEGVCSLCHSEYSDLLIHVICNCQYLTQTRDELYMSILDTGPIELSVALHAIPDRVLFRICCLVNHQLKLTQYKIFMVNQLCIISTCSAKYTLKPSVPGNNHLILLHFDSSCLKD